MATNDGTQEICHDIRLKSLLESVQTGSEMAVIVHGRMKITLELDSVETVPDPNDDDSKDDSKDDRKESGKGVKRKECENSADDSSHDSDAFASSLPSDLAESEPSPGPGQIADGCDTCVLIGTCRKCGRAFRAYPVRHAI